MLTAGRPVLLQQSCVNCGREALSECTGGHKVNYCSTFCQLGRPRLSPPPAPARPQAPAGPQAASCAVGCGRGKPLFAGGPAPVGGQRPGLAAGSQARLCVLLFPSLGL